MVGTNVKAILDAYQDIDAGRWPQGKTPELWDGKAAQRIVNIIAEKF